MTSNAKLRTIITLESESGPFISIFIALGQEHNFNAMLNQIKQAFIKKYPHNNWRAYQDQFDQRAMQKAMRSNRYQSLAIYVGPSIFHIFKLKTYPVKTSFIINNTMQIIPIIAEYQFKNLNHMAVLKKKALSNIKFHYQQSAKQNKTSNNLDDIIHAATAGQIDALIINQNVYEQNQPKVNEIMNDLAITTAGFGGNVFVLNKNQMPVADTKLAMISRI